MQSLAIRSRAAAAVARPQPQRRARTVAVAARGGGDDVPANVREAQEWVARWRAKQGGGDDGGAPAAAGKAAAAAATASPKKGKLEPCRSLPDGTLVFTADSLKKVSFKDVKL